MNKKNKTVLSVFIIVTITIILVLTDKSANNTNIIVNNDNSSLNETEQFIKDAQSALNEDVMYEIQLADNSTRFNCPNVEAINNIVTIKGTGVYKISGNLSQGQLVVDTDQEVTLLLDNVTIFNSDDSALNIINSKHTLIYLNENSSNQLMSGTKVSIDANTTINEEASGAVIYSKDDLSIAGSGNLTIEGYLNNGIASTDVLNIISGNLNISALNNGLKGKDGINIVDGSITVLSGNDGIKVNSEDEGKGYINIYNGDFNITCFGDAITSINDLYIENGNFNITAGDLSKVSETNTNKPNGNFGGFNQGNRGDHQQNKPENNGWFIRGEFNFDNKQPIENQFMIPQQNVNTNENDEKSTKGIKSDTNIIITSGSFNIKASDDTIHANKAITINGGEFILESGDDGIHSDESLTINNGLININKSYEGLESHLVYINGGGVSIIASDDGINASGGNTGNRFEIMNSSDLPIIEINGGNIYVNSSGDGIDSNGSIIVNDGKVIIDGPTSSGDSAIDAATENGGTILINGGEIFGIGSAGMAHAFAENSKQCNFLYNLNTNLPANTIVKIMDDKDNVIYQYSSIKNFNSIAFSSDKLILNKTYKIIVGDTEQSITIDKISNAIGNVSNNRNNDRFNNKK